MPPTEDVASPSQSIQSLPPAAASIRMPKHRQVGSSSPGTELPFRPLPLSHSEASLPMRRSTPNSASLYASTLTPPGSRPISPVGGSRLASPARPSSRGTGVSSSGSSTLVGSTYTKSLLETPAAENPGDPLNLILKAFVPHVAVYSSSDTDDLVREKGFHGLWELLRPFGDAVQGKVTVRDSNGGAKPWDDFAVRFVPFGSNVETPQSVHGVIQAPTAPGVLELNGNTRRRSSGGAGSNGTAAGASTVSRISLVEAIVNQHLSYAERSFLGLPRPGSQQQQQQPQNDLDPETTSPYYSLYLRRMLSGLPMSCHETFAHPVACIIAISSRNTAPIQTFQELYRDISQGTRRMPPWVDGDFLRYYVLVHDEENGDIAESMALFEKMKRSLGLHCHLLRIRGSQSAETDDDSLELPRSEWISAAEEFDNLEQSERYGGGSGGDGDEMEDDEDHNDIDYADPAAPRYIFESDATAIRTFVREMVTQSIVPTMERNIAKWNDQVASKRRGITGRFMNLSKRWAFGSSGSSNSNTSVGMGGGSSNYDAQRGFYGAESPEAVMRKLADYAFMLRDWKLAMSTYDILRSDFTNDKAWKYHAAANEMCALALLIMPPALSSRTKLESIHAMLEQAFYSYHTRCGNAYGTVRSIALGLELQRLRGGPAVDESVRWGTRLLETRLVGRVGDALLRERMAVCCGTRVGSPSVATRAPTPLGWGSWRRKSAFWSMLAAETWVAQGRYIQAQRCLNEARKMYSMLASDEGISGFAAASDFMASLQQQLKQGLSVDLSAGAAAADEEEDVTVHDLATGDVHGVIRGGSNGNDDEEVEFMADKVTEKTARRRSRRDSLLGGSGAGQAVLESAPLRKLSSPVETTDGSEEDSSGFGKV